jgi:hypothetical protein
VLDCIRNMANKLRTCGEFLSARLSLTQPPTSLNKRRKVGWNGVWLTNTQSE